MINLITSFYISNNEQRDKELKYSLIKNLDNPLISKIHLFIDSTNVKKDLDNKLNKEQLNKIVICDIGYQPKYSDLFHYAINKCTNSLCMIANSDIWLKEIIDVNILNGLNNSKLVYCLTRHEHDMSSKLIDNYCGSHDAFVFVPKMDDNIIIKHLNFYQNAWGSENVLMYELKNRLCKILKNPCKNIIIVHQHSTNLRTLHKSRINNGDINGDGIFSKRNEKCYPC